MPSRSRPKALSNDSADIVEHQCQLDLYNSTYMVESNPIMPRKWPSTCAQHTHATSVFAHTLQNPRPMQTMHLCKPMVPMQAHANSCKPMLAMQTHANPCKPMQTYANPCKPMQNHADPCKPMQTMQTRKPVQTRANPCKPVQTRDRS